MVHFYGAAKYPQYYYGQLGRQALDVKVNDVVLDVLTGHKALGAVALNARWQGVDGGLCGHVNLFSVAHESAGSAGSALDAPADFPRCSWWVFCGETPFLGVLASASMSRLGRIWNFAPNSLDVGLFVCLTTIPSGKRPF